MPIQKPKTKKERSAARKAHKEITAAGFTAATNLTFVHDGASGRELMAQSIETVPGTMGHPAKTVVMAVAEDSPKLPPKYGRKLAASRRARQKRNRYAVKIQHTDKKWQAITDPRMPLKDARELARQWKTAGFYAAVFDGRKKIWEPS